MFNDLERLVLELDPDVLTSFELQNGGWGYVGARYRHEFGELRYIGGFRKADIVSIGGDPSYGTLISRILDNHSRGGSAPGWGRDDEPSFLCTGRHVLNLWSIFRKEYTHFSYTFENSVFQVLGRR